MFLGERRVYARVNECTLTTTFPPTATRAVVGRTQCVGTRGFMKTASVAETALAHSLRPESAPGADLSALGRVAITGGSGFIGSHLLSLLHENGVPCLNVDTVPPIVPGHERVSVALDIRDTDALTTVLQDFAPDVVVHLAARTDLNGSVLADYDVNTEGTRSVVHAVNETPSVQRLIGASTQYVVPPGRIPAHDEDFIAYSPYGESKVATERILRRELTRADWIIIRPTNIWGPRHPFLPQRIWLYIRRGLYVHPGGAPIYRAYAYVDSVTTQIVQLALVGREQVFGQVFYVGEKPVDFLMWANAFSQRLAGRDVRVVPRGLWRNLALVGDVIPRFPMNSARYERMTTSDRPLVDKTLDLCGPPPTPFEEAVERTAKWLECHWSRTTARD